MSARTGQVAHDSRTGRIHGEAMNAIYFALAVYCAVLIVGALLDYRTMKVNR